MLFINKRVPLIIGSVLVSFAIFGGCKDLKTTDSDINFIPNTAFIVNTDYSTGSCTTLDMNTLNCGSSFLQATVGSDSVVRSSGGKQYVINRYGRNSIQLIDPNTGFQVITEQSTGSGSNPHDIVVASTTKAYVSRYDKPELWIVNPETLVKTGEIDLSAYASVGQAAPGMDALYFDSTRNRLFVSLGRLVGFNPPADYSSILVIDTVTDTVIADLHISLTHDANVIAPKNPYTSFKLVSAADWQPAVSDGHDHLFVACVGDWTAIGDNGIIAIDPVDLHVENGLVICERDINAKISDFEFKNGSCYITATSIAYTTSLIKATVGSSAITATLLSTGGLSLGSIRMHPTAGLVVCDRTTTKPGIRIFDANDVQRNGVDPIWNNGLPPFDLVFIK